MLGRWGASEAGAQQGLVRAVWSGARVDRGDREEDLKEYGL